MPTYRLETYDPVGGPAGEEALECDWRVRASGLTLWQLRAAIRRARELSYDDEVSIYVSRELGGPTAVADDIFLGPE